MATSGAGSGGDDADVIVVGAGPGGSAAAYHLASSLRKQSRFERSLSYARRAMERADSLGEPNLIAAVHNLLGNIQLSQSYPKQALEDYLKALEIRRGQSGDNRYSQAILLENIGYCLLLLGRVDQGLDTTLQGQKLAEEVGDRRCRTECLQDRCYGLLLAGRFEEAVILGEEALEEATSAGYLDLEENCHYLLGELGTRLGDSARRDRHLDRLQSMHPELPFLKDFLSAVDVMSFITLKR